MTHGDGHDGRGFHQSELDRIGEIDGADVTHCPLNGPAIEQITHKHLGTQGAQAIRTIVYAMDKCANNVSALKQHFRYPPAGPSLVAAGCSADENQLIRHDQVSFYSVVEKWYFTVPFRSDYGTSRYHVKGKMAESRSTTAELPEGTDEGPIRKRILDAALEVFTKHGYAQSSTLQIASRARVSKRDLYAVVGKKQDMLVACIKERAERLRLPVGLPPSRDRDTLSHTLAGFGAQLLREVSNPTVVAVFRLAIAEAEHAPEVARTLDSMGRRTSRAALMEIFIQGLSSRLLDGDPAEMTDRFMALLWGDLMVNLLLRVADPLNPRETKRRAEEAAAAFLRLYPPASGAKGRR